MIITTVSGASTVSGSPVNGILLAIHAGAGDRSKDGRAQKTAQAERDLRRRWTPATRCSNRARPPRMRYAPRFM